MKITYFFEYETDQKQQKPLNGTLNINEKELRMIKDACKRNSTNIQELIHYIIEDLTIEKAEEIFLTWKK